MPFNLCPDDGRPARIWRFVAPGALGYQGGRPIVSLLSRANNIQLLDKELLESMGELDRLQTLHTGSVCITV